MIKPWIPTLLITGLLLFLAPLSHAQKPMIAGVIRDTDYVEARSIAKANGINIDSWDWNSQYYLYSRGKDKSPEPKTTSPSSISSNKLDKLLSYMWNNVGKLFALALFIFVLYFAGKSEYDATDAKSHNDYYTRVVDGNYHGDDAFEVPNGMNSQHRSVPTRAYNNPKSGESKSERIYFG